MNKRFCGGCKKEQAISNFYTTSHTDMFPDGYLHMCKKCIKVMVNEDDLESVFKVLRTFNIPYVPDQWERCKKSKTDTFGGYYRFITTSKQYKNQSWGNSGSFSSQNNDSISAEQKNTDQSSKVIVEDSTIGFWGFGYTNEEYKEFERKYHRLKKNYKEKTEMHTESLKTYIRYRVKEEFATARGDSREAKAWGELASKAAADAKLNPNQMSKSDVSDGVDVMSQLAEIVESHVGVVCIMPRLLEQPYDDADMIIWSNINYSRKLEEKPRVPYREVYQFYDQMIEDYCKDRNMSESEINDYKQRRKNIFRDMELVFQEPVYSTIDEEGSDNE